jgi:hypothetical protein
MRKFRQLLPLLPIDFVKNIQLISLFTEQELNDCQSSVKKGIEGRVFFNILSFLDARYVYKVKQTFFSEKQRALCLVDKKELTYSRLVGLYKMIMMYASMLSNKALKQFSTYHINMIDILILHLRQ